VKYIKGCERFLVRPRMQAANWKTLGSWQEDAEVSWRDGTLPRKPLLTATTRHVDIEPVLPDLLVCEEKLEVWCSLGIKLIKAT
jgi:hypothetical protein